MLAAIFILLFAGVLIFVLADYQVKPKDNATDEVRNNPQMRKLWQLAQNSMKERKPLHAEKALLTILKFDEHNAAAYNRLGILYAKENRFKEAIECFEIAESLDNNAASLHNVGLIYLKTGRFEKAAMAFKQAIALEGDQPGRYIAYAKALEQLGERISAVEALETAYSLSPSTVVLRHILEIYERSGDPDNIAATTARITKLQEEKEAKLTQKTKKTRRLDSSSAAGAHKAKLDMKPKRNFKRFSKALRKEKSSILKKRSLSKKTKIM